MRKATFSGGIHPRYEKELASEAPIEPLSPPQQVVLPLSQHIGAPARPLVKKGDRVLAGQVLAEAGGFVSVPIHSPVSGKVVEVGPRPHPGGEDLPAVVVDNDGNDEWVELDGFDDPMAEDPDRLRDRIRDAGIVGLGGAAFPTHVKLSPPKDKAIDVLLLNGAECEPYLTADDRLMREHPERIAAGLRAEMHILGVERALVCIEDNKPEAIEAMARATADLDTVKVQVLATKYPQGGEKQLIEAVVGRQVPSGGLPMDVGVVVSNVGTAAAIHDALWDGRPLVERVCTVTGRAVNKPSNFLVRIGTPIDHLLQAAGGTEIDPGKVILGGPMMGLALSTTKVPVLKGTSGVLVQTRDEVLSAGYMACIRCGMCVRACPVQLTPNEMGSRVEIQDWETVEELGIMDCIECGSCSWVCPSHRPLVQMFRFGKVKVRASNSARQAGGN